MFLLPEYYDRFSFWFTLRQNYRGQTHSDHTSENCEYRGFQFTYILIFSWHPKNTVKSVITIKVDALKINSLGQPFVFPSKVRSQNPSCFFSLVLYCFEEKSGAISRYLFFGICLKIMCMLTYIYRLWLNYFNFNSISRRLGEYSI